MERYTVSYDPCYHYNRWMIMNSDFKKQAVAVIGLGLMGGSFAERLTELGCFVIGFNRTEETAEQALRMGLVQSVNPQDLKKADIVIFCTQLAPYTGAAPARNGLYIRTSYVWPGRSRTGAGGWDDF